MNRLSLKILKLQNILFHLTFFSPLFWPTKHRPFLKITACPSWILDKNKLHKKIPEIFIWKEQKLSEISIWIVDLMNYLFPWKKFFWWFQNHRGPVGSFFLDFLKSVATLFIKLTTHYFAWLWLIWLWSIRWTTTRWTSFIKKKYSGSTFKDLDFRFIFNFRNFSLSIKKILILSRATFVFHSSNVTVKTSREYHVWLQIDHSRWLLESFSIASLV